jgi:hypothetical protein
VNVRIAALVLGVVFASTVCAEPVLVVCKEESSRLGTLEPDVYASVQTIIFDLDQNYVHLPEGGGRWKIDQITSNLIKWNIGWFDRVKMEGAVYLTSYHISYKACQVKRAQF